MLPYGTCSAPTLRGCEHTGKRTGKPNKADGHGRGLSLEMDRHVELDSMASMMYASGCPEQLSILRRGYTAALKAIQLVTSLGGDPI